MCAILYLAHNSISHLFVSPAIAIYKPQDVRPILKAYEGKDIPIEYAKHEAELKRKHIEEWEHSRKGLATTGFTFSSLFGGSQVRPPSCPPVAF